MRRNILLVSFIFVITLAIAVWIIFSQTTAVSKSVSGENEVIYNPPFPQEAPEDIKDEVMLGYYIVVDTQNYVAPYVGNKLNCTNCHFEGGITKGGENGGISLVGVGAVYPQYRARNQAVVSLVTKVSDCFKRSMNGKTLPPEGREMTALLTYLQWISKGVPVYSQIPWLGIKKLESEHQPDFEQGRQLFSQICFICHGNEGQGRTAPPLWGDESFNDGAGMAKLPVMAAFVFYNMPRGNPTLSPEESLDVASYVLDQPRPDFVEEK